MTHVATLGTSSCATIAIGGFKGNARAQNEAYKAEPEKFPVPKEGLTVKSFYDTVLYPPSQPLGRSHDMPLEQLMQEIDKSSLKTKLVMATINQAQYLEGGNYWADEFNRWGFKLIAKTKNAIGSINYMYMRNPSEVEIKEGEH